MKSASLTAYSEITSALVRTVTDLINANGQEFYNWQRAKMGNDLFINDPDRADRIHEAAEYGADGSTHAEHLEDFTEYAEEYYDTLQRAADHLDIDEATVDILNMEIETAKEALLSDLVRLEEYHAEAGTLHEQVG